VIGGACGSLNQAWHGRRFSLLLGRPWLSPVHTLSHTHQVPQPPPRTPRPAVGVSCTWTVSARPLSSDSARRARTNLPVTARGRARASPSLPSPSRVDASRTSSPTPGTALYRVLVASPRPLSPVLVACSLTRPAPLHRSLSIKRPFTIEIGHQTSIAGAFSNKLGRFLRNQSRVISLYPTHPLAPAGPARLLKYCADHLSQLRPS
jgi:hypothetical protein